MLLGVSSIGIAQVGTWKRVADMPTKRAFLSSTVLEGKIYVVGGADGCNSLPSLEVYDPVANIWHRKADMPTARDALGTVNVNGRIYAIGGLRECNGPVYSVVDMYNPLTDTWTKLSDMPQERASFVAAEIDGSIYVIGGFTGSSVGAVPTVTVYTPSTDTWTTLPDMPSPRAWMIFHQAPVVKGEIYLIGGASSFQNPVSIVEAYNPSTHTWTRKADMPTARWGVSATVIEGKIYVIGGFAGVQNGLSTVEIYDPETDTWTTGTDMPTPRGALAAGTVNGYIYTIGGRDLNTDIASAIEEYDPGTGIRINIISPQEGSVTGGEPIAMSGTNFPPDAIVTIGGKPLINQEIINGTVISGITPPGTPGEYNILIDSPSIGFTAFAGKFLYPTPFPPTITAINPNQGPLSGGQIATIEGSGFIPGVSVVISDVEATVTAFTPTHITFTTPPHTEGAKFVLVRNVDRKVGFLDGGYTYIDVEFLPEDLNLDGIVDLFDLVLVASQFGLVEANLSADVNGEDEAGE